MEKSKKPLVVVIADIIKKRGWLYSAGIPQRIFSRLSSVHPVEFHAQEPSKRYPYLERRNYVPIGVKQDTVEKFKSPLRKALQALRSGWKSNFRLAGKAVPYERTVPALIGKAKAAGVSYLALVMDDNVAVFPEAVELAFRFAKREKADLLYATQIEGLLPTIVSISLLEKWLECDPNPNLKLLQTPDKLSGFGKVVGIDFLDAGKYSGQIRCSPLDLHEAWLLEYWEGVADELERALKQISESWGEGRLKLEKIIRTYCSKFAPGLETYRIVGTLYDVEDLRQRMMTTKKPLTDYFVIATHYGRFLQKYAGLKPNSHVVDIGCSWGYLGFALGNFLNKNDGAYLGVEVQEEATKWSKERLGWLGDNFQFVYLDIHNDYYNPEGMTPRGQVRLPVPDQWANVIFLGSVFTHMQEDGVQSYLEEFYRILAPGGIVTFSYIDSSYWNFGKEYAIEDMRVPDKTTVYSREKIKYMIERAGLKTARDPVNIRQFDRTDYQTWYFAER